MNAPLMSLHHVTKTFASGSRRFTVLDGIDFDIAQSETLGLVGESGCGKSTLGKAILGLLPIDSGTVRFDGSDLGALGTRERFAVRARMQMVFQDPVASFNPRARVGRILEEPLIVYRRGRAAERRARVAEIVSKVGLHPEMLGRYPGEFSGGQRQRIGIARALMLQPDLIVCDEAVSALDVSVRAQVINLLLELREEFRVAYLFISHDLSVVRHLSDRVAVMYLGRIVELGDSDSLWREPLHPYTKSLIAAVPSPDPSLARRRERIVLKGELPSPLAPPAGCPFHPRCPIATERCGQEPPTLRAVSASRNVACHLV